MTLFFSFLGLLIIGLILCVISLLLDVRSDVGKGVPLVSAAAERQIKLGTMDVRGDVAVLSARVIELEKKYGALVAALRDVVQETAGDVIDNDQGVPIRRVRGLRAALWRMEAESAREPADGK